MLSHSCLCDYHTDVDSVGLIEAWQRWFAGEQIADLEFLGWQVLYWGRLGKILGAAGIVILIVDIIGPEKLRESARPLKTIEALGKDVVRGITGRVARSVASEGGPVTNEDRVIGSVVVLVLAGAAAFFIYKTIFDWRTILIPDEYEFSFFGDWRSGLLRLGLLIVAAGAIPLIGMTLLVILALLTIAMTLPIEMVAKALDRPTLERWIRTVTVVIVLIGFHFDLLAS